jgi:hypothetical protein
MKRIKKAFDPNNILNPGKIFPSPFPSPSRGEGREEVKWAGSDAKGH